MLVQQFLTPSSSDYMDAIELPKYYLPCLRLDWEYVFIEHYGVL